MEERGVGCQRVIKSCILILYLESEYRIYVEERTSDASWSRIPPNLGLVGPIAQNGEMIRELIKEGGECILTVFEGSSEETFTKFREMDASMFLFVATKVVYYFALNGDTDSPVPNFLKEGTRNKIVALREKYREQNAEEKAELFLQLNPLFCDPDNFDQPPPAVKEVFNELRAIGSRELQDSLFSTRCFHKAVELHSLES